MDNQINHHQITSNTTRRQDAVARYTVLILFIFLLIASWLYVKQAFDKAAIQSQSVNTLSTGSPLIVSDSIEPRLENIVLNKPVLVNDYVFANHLATPMLQQSQATISTEHAMKVQEHTIPGSALIKPKMTEFLPDDLKHAIKSSMLTDEQIKALSEAERKAYKRTQRDIVDTLRELAGIEAENQRLKGDLGNKIQTNEALNQEINELRKQFQ